MKIQKFLRIVGVVSIFTMALTAQATVFAAASTEIDAKAQKALDDLYASTPEAKALGAKAYGILVFPSIVKGGFIVGGQYGEGVLIRNGKMAGHYNSAAASYGLQAGLQSFGYALFFMSEADMAYLDSSGGWEVGGAPSLVIVDSGMATSLSTTTIQNGVYAFFYGQKGLMAGLGLQGTKISKIAD